MKKAIGLIVGVSMFFVFTAGIASAGTTVMNYDFEKPTLTRVSIDDVDYDRIVMPSCPNGGNAGEPALPTHPARILIPAGERITAVEVILGQRVKLGQDLTIEPRSMPERLSTGPRAAKPPVPDPRIYGSAVPFPRQSFYEIGTQLFRGYAIHILRMTPVVYYPLTGELWYYPRMTVRVSTTPTNEVSAFLRGCRIDEVELRTRVDNVDVAVGYRRFWPANDGKTTGFSMLILTTTALSPAFSPLKAHHDAAGIPTEIRHLEDIGHFTPDAIRDFIRTHYQQNGIEYVLIGGDDDVIPVRGLYVSSGYYTENAMPGDIFYACLDGTYNFDGDSRWGEPTDGDSGGDVDMVAEVFVGRAPVGTLAEAQRFVTKTLWYLNNSHANIDRVQLVGEHLGFGGLSEYAANTLNQLVDVSTDDGYTTQGIPSLTYMVDRLYDATWPTHDWPVSELTSRINAGVHLLDHLGHGDVTYAMKLYNDDVLSSLTNNDLCFVYSQTCLAGHFDQADCWAEAVTIKTDHGAFAAIMNARYGWGEYDSTDGPSQRFNREFWDAVYNPAENKPQLGRANQDSKEDNLYRINEDCMRWCCYELNLFGDPTIAVKTPSGLFIRHTPLEDTMSIEDITIEATILSTEGTIETAELFWSNGGSPQTISLQPAGGDLFRGTIPGQDRCTTVQYWINAVDSVGNTKRFPPDPDVCSFQIATYSSLYADPIEYGTHFWSHYPLGSGAPDQWAVRDHRNHTSGGHFAWKFGTATANGSYAVNAHAAVATPSIRITEPSALHFWMWGAIEDGYSSSAYDGGWVEISVDGGPWQLLTPSGGYPFTLNDGNQPCWSGSFGWTQVSIDLAVPLQSLVSFRFCFKSDYYLSYEGWYIDDVSVEGIQCNPTAIVPVMGSSGAILLLLALSFCLWETAGRRAQRASNR